MTSKFRFCLMAVLTWLLLGAGAAWATDLERDRWMLPAASDQRVIHIPRSTGGEKSITFLVEPFASVVSPADGVLIYKGPLSASETALVLSHEGGTYSVITSPFEWEASHFVPATGVRLTQGQFLVNARGGSSVRIPVTWRVFRGVDDRLGSVRDLDQFIETGQATQLGFKNRSDALNRIFSGKETNTKQLMNLGAVQFDFGNEISKQDDFSVTLDKKEIPLVEQIFEAFLLPVGAYDIAVTSGGGFFKTTKKNTVFVTATGTSKQWLQRARSGDIMAVMSDFIPGAYDAPLPLASADAVPDEGESKNPIEKANQDRLAAEERAHEQERQAQAIKAAEQERLAQQAQEAERLAQVAAEKEKLRVAEAARVQEQQRLAQEAQAKESERLAQEAKTKEQERLAQAAKVREQERLAQAAAEQEKLRVAEAARVQEQARLAQEAQAKQAQRLAQEARTQEKERLAQEERVKNELLLAARQRDDELLKLRQQLAKLEDEKVSKDQQTIYATRRALVIGNDSYRQVTKLVNAREDARAIAESLQQVGYQVTLKLDLTEKDMKAALRTFKGQVEGGDEVLVFFAGHGVQFGAANYLLPVDIAGESEEQIKDESIQLQRVLDDMSEKKAKFTLAMIDACRDNPFKTVNRNIGGRGLAPTTAATGQMVIFSAGAGQQALDKLGPADKSRNGLFTRIFLKEMQKPGVSIDKVVRNVRNEVVGMAKSVGHEQVPAIYDQVVGEFYFRR